LLRWGLCPDAFASQLCPYTTHPFVLSSINERRCRRDEPVVPKHCHITAYRCYLGPDTQSPSPPKPVALPPSSLYFLIFFQTRLRPTRTCYFPYRATFMVFSPYPPQFFSDPDALGIVGKRLSRRVERVQDREIWCSRCGDRRILSIVWPHPYIFHVFCCFLCSMLFCPFLSVPNTVGLLGH